MLLCLLIYGRTNWYCAARSLWTSHIDHYFVIFVCFCFVFLLCMSLCFCLSGIGLAACLISAWLPDSNKWWWQRRFDKWLDDNCHEHYFISATQITFSPGFVLQLLDGWFVWLFALEVDWISASVSSPNVDKLALLANIQFRPKAVIPHSVHFRFRRAAVGKCGGCRK